VSSSASSSAGATCMPLYLISSFVRSTMKNHPSSSTVADVRQCDTSLSRSIELAVSSGLPRIAFIDLRASHEELAFFVWPPSSRRSRGFNDLHFGVRDDAAGRARVELRRVSGSGASPARFPSCRSPGVTGHFILSESSPRLIRAERGRAGEDQPHVERSNCGDGPARRGIRRASSPRG